MNNTERLSSNQKAPLVIEIGKCIVGAIPCGRPSVNFVHKKRPVTADEKRLKIKKYPALDRIRLSSKNAVVRQLWRA